MSKDRFAFKIDKALKANLYTICRLCGIDNPEKVQIIPKAKPREIVDVDGEPDLCAKIRECIGLTITKDDKMPQTMCVLCVDKINDFFEFREMCYATNSQTRKLLGLKPINPKKESVDMKPVITLMNEHPPAARRGRKRKSDEMVPILPAVNNKSFRLGEPVSITQKKYKLAMMTHRQQYQQKEEIKVEPLEILAMKHSANMCNICNQFFSTKLKLDRHKAITHLPNIPRYVCMACDETLKKNDAIKSHQLWHKFTKTPFLCGLCWMTIPNTYAMTRHIREHNAKVQETPPVLDRICPQCNLTFATPYLYNIHQCAARTKICAGCELALPREKEYRQHLAICPNAYRIYSTYVRGAAMVDDGIRIKNEIDVETSALTPIITLTQLPHDVQLTDQRSEGGVASEVKKGGKKISAKKAMQRMDELLKSTLDVLGSIKHEPEVHVDTDAAVKEAANGETSIEADNLHSQDAAENGYGDETGTLEDFHYADDDNSEADDAAEPVSTQMDKPLLRAVSVKSIVAGVTVKQELIDEAYGHSDDKAAGAEGCSRKEVPMLKIKIKKEHGTLNSSMVDGEEGDRESREKRRKEKKKKRKNTDKGRDSDNQLGSLAQAKQKGSGDPHVIRMPQPGVIRIKQERLSTDDESSSMMKSSVATSSTIISSQQTPHQEPTVMTSIPAAQLENFSMSELTSTSKLEQIGVGEAKGDSEIRDIKPNRYELDRIMAAAKASSESGGNVSTSTGSEPRSGPKIVAISSGIDAIRKYPSIGHIRIKPEPRGRGYADESDEERGPQQEFIEVINFHSWKIKQEPAIEMTDVHSSQVSTAAEPEPDVNVKINPQNIATGQLQPSQTQTMDEGETESQPSSPAGEDHQGVTKSCDEDVNSFNHQLSPFVITSVRGEATDFMAASPLNSGTSDANPPQATVSGMIIEDKEHLNETRPCLESARGQSSPEPVPPLSGGNQNESDAEEHQNILNHEMVAAAGASTSLSSEHQVTSDSLPSPTKIPTEETDNLINEFAAASMQSPQSQSLSPSSTHGRRDSAAGSSMPAEDNVNEIAENNNNANIEREFELQDEQQPPTGAGQAAIMDDQQCNSQSSSCTPDID